MYISMFGTQATSMYTIECPSIPTAIVANIDRSITTLSSIQPLVLYIESSLLLIPTVLQRHP